MSALDLFPAEAAAKMERGSPVDLNDTGFFQGSLTAPAKGLAKGLLVEPARVMNLGMSLIPAAIDQAYGTNSREWWFENMMLERASRAVTPNPREVGVAGQMLHSLTDIGGQALVGGPAFVGISKTVGKSIEGVEEGLDPLTAMKKGGIEGGSAALGVALPIAMPTILGSRIPGLVQQLGYGVASNVPMGIVSRSLTHEVLAKNYPQMAEQYKALDEGALATDLVLGLAFGGLGHAITAKGAPLPAIRPSDIDAALTKRNAYHIEVESAPGLARNGETRDAHVESVLKATEDLINGRPVDVSETLRAADFEPNGPLEKVRTDLQAQTEKVAEPIRREAEVTRASAEAVSSARLVEESAVTLPKLTNKAVGSAFDSLVGAHREDVDAVLYNWNGAALNEDGTKIILYPGRDGEFSRGADGGKVRVSKREFLNWLYSDQPFDPKVYVVDDEWRSQVARLREAAGFNPAKAGEPKVDPFLTPDMMAPAKPAAPLTIEHPAVRTMLQHMAEHEAGWAEVGGRMVRQKHSEVQGDETITRTQWIPKADWWQGRPGGLNEARTQEAVRKALAGEELKAAEKRAVDHMIDVANERIAEKEAIGDAEWAAVANDVKAEGLEPTHRNIVDADLVAKAATIDEAALEAAAVKFENDDAAFMAEVRRIINENQKPDEGAAGGGQADQGAQGAGRAAGETRGGQEGGQAAGRQAGEAGQEGQASRRVDDAGVRDAEDLAAAHPDMLVSLEDGTTVTAAEALAKADEVIAQAEHDAKGFEAAVLCATRRGG